MIARASPSAASRRFVAALAAVSTGAGRLAAAEPAKPAAAAVPALPPGVSVVAEDLLVPEGPIAMAGGSIVRVEMRAKTLSRIDRAGKRSVIATFQPDGRYVHVPTPDPVTTNLCFGGTDLRDVWITGSASGRPYRMRWPGPGHKTAHLA